MKKILLFLFMLSLCLTACGAEPSVTSEPETAPAISTISKEHCFLCGDGAKDLPYWGQDNVGIISLNTFEIIPIEINRYDNDGALIEKNTGEIQWQGSGPDSGFYAHILQNPNHGYAVGEISFLEDAVLNAEKTAAFLCQTCLDTVLSRLLEKGSGVGIIHFGTREIQILETRVAGFSLGDYYINCDWKGQNETGALRVLMLYCPPRYPE